MACCIEDAKVAEIGDTDASLQISDPSSAHFASFLTDIPASLNDSLHDGLASIWTLCIEAPSEDKRRILTPAAAQHEEDISNDANQLERGQRRLRNITSSRGRNLANGRNQGSPKPIHLSAKQTYEYHAEARNACRTPIGLQRVLDDVSRKGGSGDIRAAQAKFSVSEHVKLVSGILNASAVAIDSSIWCELSSANSFWMKRNFLGCFLCEDERNIFGSSIFYLSDIFNSRSSQIQEMFLTDKRRGEVKQLKAEMYVASRNQDPGNCFVLQMVAGCI